MGDLLKTIVETTADGAQIAELVLQLEGVLGDVERGPALISLLSLVLIIMHPDITAEQLADSVKDVSKYICMMHATPTEGAPN